MQKKTNFTKLLKQIKISIRKKTLIIKKINRNNWMKKVWFLWLFFGREVQWKQEENKKRHYLRKLNTKKKFFL
jgi:hypothetical protein